MLRNRSYDSSCATEFLVQVSTNGALFVLPLLLTAGYDADVGTIAWCMAPMPIGMAISAPLAGRFIRRWGEPRTSLAGMGAIGASLAAMVVADQTHLLGLLLGAWLVVGLGNGLVRPAIAAAAADALDPADYGAGMAATRMISTIGARAGITLAISCGAGSAAIVAASIAGFLGVATSCGLLRGTVRSAQREPLATPR